MNQLRDIVKGMDIGALLNTEEGIRSLCALMERQKAIIMERHCPYTPCSIVHVPKYAYDCYRCARGQKVAVVEARIYETFHTDNTRTYSLIVNAKNENGESCDWYERLEDMQ